MLLLMLLLLCTGVAPIDAGAGRAWPPSARTLQHHHNMRQIDRFLPEQEVRELLTLGRRQLGQTSTKARQDALARAAGLAVSDSSAVRSVRSRVARMLRIADESSIDLTFVESPAADREEREYRYTHALHDGHDTIINTGQVAPVFSLALFLTGPHEHPAASRVAESESSE